MLSLVPAILFGLLGLAVGAAAAHGAEAVLANRQIATRCPYCTGSYDRLQWSAVLATLTGRGRCTACGRFLRFPRVVGELFLALGWGLLVGVYGVTPRTGLAMLALLPLAMIMVTDLEAKLVPNRIMLPALGAMLVSGVALGPALPVAGYFRWWHALAGAAVGFGVFRLLVWIGVAIFGEGALGEGDITLAAYVGVVVGFPLIVESLLLTFAFGGIGAAAVLALRRGKLGTAIPYGPFIILGCAVTQVWGGEILRWFMS